MESRTRRNTSKRDKAKDRLQELESLRSSGARRAEQFELREEDAVYDVYEEDDYVDADALLMDKLPLEDEPKLPLPEISKDKS
eukprot:jgi/Pico_ML_1/53471/g4008.t1